MLANSDLPIVNVFALAVGPAAQQVSECGLVKDAGNGPVNTFPHLGERRVGFAPATCPGFAWTLDESQHLAHGDGLRRPREEVTAFGAAPRLHESGLLQARKDQLQEFLWDLLPLRNIGDFDRLSGSLGSQVKDGL